MALWSWTVDFRKFLCKFQTFSGSQFLPKLWLTVVGVCLGVKDTSASYLNKLPKPFSFQGELLNGSVAKDTHTSVPVDYLEVSKHSVLLAAAQMLWGPIYQESRQFSLNCACLLSTLRSVHLQRENLCLVQWSIQASLASYRSNSWLSMRRIGCKAWTQRGPFSFNSHPSAAQVPGQVISEQVGTQGPELLLLGKRSTESLSVDPHQFLSNMTKAFPDWLQDVFYLHHSSPAAEEKPSRWLGPSTHAHEATWKHLAVVVSSCN